METNIRFIFLKIGLLVLFISFILQCILCGSNSFKSINFLISNWKKTPIIGLSLSKNNEGYNEDDYFKINSTKIYIKRMNKKYNFLYLKSRNFGKFYYKTYKKCGNYTYFKVNEECPINYIKFKKEYNSDEKSIYFKYI